MALTVINPSRASFGEELGTGLGQSISSGLQQLAANKLKSMQKQSLIKGLGVSPEEANFLQQYPELIKPFLQNRGGSSQGGLVGALSMGSPQERIQQERLELEKRRFDKEVATSEEKAKTSKQQSIDSSNKPFLDQLNKGIPVAEEMYDKANEMLRLLETGKIATGLGGALSETEIPKTGIKPGKIFLNPESQRFIALSNDIAALLAANSGVATGFKIKFAAERKPALYQKRETQIALTKDILKQAEKVLGRQRIVSELLEGNNYQQPPNLRSRVEDIWNERKGEVAQEKKERKSLGLPNPNKFSEDAIIEGNDGKQYKKDANNKQWIPVQ